MDVNIDCMCEYLFLFVLCQDVTYYCTALCAVFDWICALQVFVYYYSGSERFFEKYDLKRAWSLIKVVICQEVHCAFKLRKSHSLGNKRVSAQES